MDDESLFKTYKVPVIPPSKFTDPSTGPYAFKQKANNWRKAQKQKRLKQRVS